MRPARALLPSTKIVGKQKKDSGLSPTSFDTTETYLYKIAANIGKPVEYIHVNSFFTLNPEYTDVDELIRTAIAADVQLSTIAHYLDVMGVNDSVDKIENIMLDIGIKSLNTTAKQLIDIGPKSVAMKQLKTLIDEIETFLTNKGRIVDDIGKYNIKLYQTKHTKYIRTLAKSLWRTKEIAAEIEEVHATYADVLSNSPLKASDIRIIVEDLELIIEDDSIESKNVLSVFDGIELSNEVRHVVCYATYELVYQKVYKGVPLTSKDLVDRDMYKLAKNQSVMKSSSQIVFTVNVGSVYTVVYNLDGKYMSVSVKSYDKTKVLDAINKAFPHVAYNETAVSIESQVRLYPVKDNAFSMAFHYLLHRSVISPEYYQFFLNESTSPYPKKTNIKLRYRPYWTMAKSVTKKEEGYAVITTPQTVLGTNYIEIALTGRSMVSIWRILTSFIPMIVMYYKYDIMVESDLAPIYNDKIHGLIDVIVKPTKKATKGQLHDEWPQVFSELYVANVEPKNLVITTTNPDVANEWRHEMISVKGQEYARQVMPFPEHGDVMFWFTSLNKDSQYVGYITNTYDEDPLFPVVPYSAPSKQALTKQHDISRKAFSKHATGPEGVAPGTEVLNELIGIPVVRLGTDIKPDSVLRAIGMYIADDNGYNEDISMYARNIRNELESYDTALYKQELYDWTDEEIKEGLHNKDKYFDPHLYIAGLMELTGCDIYIISIKVEFNVRVHRLEVPRHFQFYTGHADANKCLILCMNYGIKSDNLTYPHCELIVAEDYTSVRQGALFDEDVSQRLKNVLLACNPQIPYYNLNSYIDRYTISKMNNIIARLFDLGYIVVWQYVDPYGKARAFTFNNPNEKPISLFCSPCSPWNVPHIDTIHAMNIDVFEKLMGTKCVGRSNVGAWCIDADTEEIIYSRLFEVPMHLQHTGDDPIVTDESIHVSGKVASIDRKSAAILSELIRWLFEVYCHEQRVMDIEITQQTVTTFVNKFLRYSSKASIAHYDISNIQEKLPQYLTTDSVLEYISSVFTIKEKTIVLHNKAYVDSLAYYLMKGVKRVIFNDYIEIEPMYITNFYSSLYDFKTRPDTVILSGLIDPIAKASHPELQYMILPSLLPEHSQVITPLLYIQRGKMNSVLYLVQSTQLGKIGSAVRLCEAWSAHHINIGYDVPDVVHNATNDIVIYIIVAGRLVEHSYIKSKVAGKGLYEVVMYDESAGRLKGKYGALLRLSTMNTQM